MEIKSASGSEPAAEQQLCARRRLVRSAFALPAALTVASGSVAANSNMRCLANQIAGASSPFPPPTREKDAQPVFQRVPLAVLRHNNESKSTYYVRGATIAQELRASSYTKPNQNEFQLFNLGSNSEVALQIFSSPLVVPSQFTYLEESGWYAVLRFNASGLVVGVGNPPAGTTGTSPVTQSCWHSFG
jgi:hypothetical protein